MTRRRRSGDPATPPTTTTAVSAGAETLGSSSTEETTLAPQTGGADSGKTPSTRSHRIGHPPNRHPSQRSQESSSSSSSESDRRRRVRLLPPSVFLTRTHSAASRETLWEEQKLKLKQPSNRTAKTQSMRHDSTPSFVDIPETFENEADANSSNLVVAAAHSNDATVSDQHPSGNHTNDSKKSKTKNLQSFTRSMLSSIQEFRDLCGAAVNHPMVQVTIILLIVVNALLMGIGTFDFVTNNPAVNYAFDEVDKAFLIIFTIELILQFIYRGIHLFTDGWLLFDTVIVVLSWSLESLQIVRAFRIFRAVRLVTRVAVLKNLILAIFAVAPSMAAIVVFLVLILYIYAVMCTVLFGDLFEEQVTDQDYFGTLFLSLFTLFQMSTLEWANIVRQVMSKYYWAWAVFSSFLVVTGFILYSLVIAVVCDAVKVTEHHDEMAEHVHEKEEIRQRVYLAEQRISDLAQQQYAILESLHLALKELETLSETNAADNEDATFECPRDDGGDSSEEGSSGADALEEKPIVQRTSSSRSDQSDARRPVWRSHSSLSDQSGRPSPPRGNHSTRSDESLGHRLSPRRNTPERSERSERFASPGRNNSERSERSRRLAPPGRSNSQCCEQSGRLSSPKRNDSQRSERSERLSAPKRNDSQRSERSAPRSPPIRIRRTVDEMELQAATDHAIVDLSDPGEEDGSDSSSSNDSRSCYGGSRYLSEEELEEALHSVEGAG